MSNELNPIYEDRIFFTPIITTNITVTQEHVDNVYKLKEQYPESDQISNAGGWQSKKLQYETPLTREIKKYVDDLSWKFGYRTPTVLHQWWYNINQKNDYNYQHHHGYRGRFSAVLYLKVPTAQEGENVGNLIFSRADPGRGMYYDVHETNEYNWTDFYVEPQVGRLVIFPCWLDHHVNRSTVEGDRISMALNFDGEISYQ